MTTGQKIKHFRELKGMTQEELARACGFKGRSSINRIEKDHGGVPSKKIVMIANILEVSPEYLLGWGDRLPGQISMIADIVDDDYYTLHPQKQTPKEKLLSIINEASEDQIDLLLSLTEAVIKNRKG